MADRLTRSDIGAWLFKCNPREWDIQAALRDGKRIDSWRVHDSYRIRLIEPGDPALIWVTGLKGADPTPGIWAVGYTTGELFEDRGDDYWVHTERAQQRSIHAGLLMWPITAVPRERVAADPACADLEVLRQPQMSNPSYLTPGQYRSIADMVDRWPSYN